MNLKNVNVAFVDFMLLKISNIRVLFRIIKCLKKINSEFQGLILNR
jgi:hypothetical protein